MTVPSAQDLGRIARGYHEDPAQSMSLRAEAYTEPEWAEADLARIFGRTWQWICHVEKLRAPGSYVSATVAGVGAEREGSWPLGIRRARSVLPDIVAE